MVRARPLVPMTGHLNTTAYILYDSVLPTLRQQFGEDPLLFQHDNAPMHKVRSIQKWFVEIGVEELDWPAQSPDLNSIEHLWDQLERRLRSRSNCPTSVPDLPNALVADWKQVPAALFQHLMESLPRRVEAVIAAKGDQLHHSYFLNGGKAFHSSKEDHTQYRRMTPSLPRYDGYYINT